MKTIYILEDEKNICELVKFNLDIAGYDVSIFENGKSFWQGINKKIPDLCLLDIMLPDVNGVDVCSKLRMNEATSMIPIIMLTAKSEEIDKVVALEIGADDYITKPFGVRELVSRVKALIRRSNFVDKVAFNDSLLNHPPFTMNYDQRTLTKKDKIITLSNKEFELFYLLLSNPGRVYTRDIILNKIWGYEYFGDTRTVDVHIRHIRSKINDSDDPHQYIGTIINVGYKFIT